ncbi:hypothetical protein CROQUDRAFT_132856 [Cronartium quercuum f. sp. fusiforme G11]|uniref:laccase n=1 Tax=Cronartium quercuum f. sp. fusiforme G11 TaxID=708437 RepID=A0A9P6NMP2_9BASI|nr:hypothetical protein CROQUDRAFT_132856 [Cronartium quercuum f. sp. fusiforme G11]
MVYHITLFKFFLLTITWSYEIVKAGWQPNAILRISEQLLAGDCTLRPSVTVNGTSPGPTLRFRAGERVWIRVFNDLLYENTTLHFHGLTQYGSPFAERGSAGTYVYHTHVGFELVSAYGAFIVDDEEPPPYAYDEDLTLLFGDYYHKTDNQIVSGLEGRPFKWPGEPSSLTLNGDALGICSGSNAECRAIGITALTFIYIGIEDHHQIEVIEADAAYLRPVETNHLRLHSGQRYSFLLRTKTRSELFQAGKNTFWGLIESRWRPERVRGAFVVRYDLEEDQVVSKICTEANTPAPTDIQLTVPLPNERVGWVDRAFAPLHPRDACPTESQVTRRIIIRAQQRPTAGGGSQWFVNDKVYSEKFPAIPYLLQAYLYPSMLKPDYQAARLNLGFDPSTSTFPIKLGETIEFVVFNVASVTGEAEAHPWHFHGQHPFMVAQGYGPYSPEQARQIEIQNLERYGGRPHRRDTQVILPGLGATYSKEKIHPGLLSSWIVLRMRAVVSGAFLIHCHISPHSIMGMASVLLIGIESLPALPMKFIKQHASYNRITAETPSSYFELVPSRIQILKSFN